MVLDWSDNSGIITEEHIKYYHILHVSSGMDGGNIPTLPHDFDYNWVVYCGTKIKEQVDVPVIAVKDIRTPKQAKYLVENNMTDFVAIGRGHLADPDWANKAKNNTEIIQYLNISLFSMHET